MSLMAIFQLSALNAQTLAQPNLAAGYEKKGVSLRKALVSWDKSEIATSDKYIAAFRDLNGDGKQEAIVYLIGHDWCGTGGCTVLVLTNSGTAWKVISDTATTHLPIRILDNKSHGWRSLGVWVEGGGIEPGYEAELKFDGKTYPGGPPASPTKIVAGEVLIPNDEKLSRPIYEESTPDLGTRGKFGESPE